MHAAAPAPIALDAEAMAAASESGVAPSRAQLHVQIHTPYQADGNTPRHSTAAAAAAQQELPPQSSSGTAAAATSSANAALKSAPPAKGLRGCPSQASRRAPAEGSNGAGRSVSVQPQARYASPSAAAAQQERSKSSRRVLVPESTAAATTGGAVRNGRAPGQRRTRFVDPMPETTSLGATATSVSIPDAPPRRVQPGRAASPQQQQQQRKVVVAPQSSTVIGHSSLYTNAIPMQRNPTRTPQRVPAAAAASENGAVAAAGTAAQPHTTTAHHRRRLVNIPPAPAPLAPVISIDTDGQSSPQTASPVTVLSPKAKYPVDAEAAAADAGDLRKASDAGTNTTAASSTVLENGAGAAAAADGSAAAGEKSAERPTMTAEMHRDNKHIVISRPTANPHSIRMSDLARPSEAYKLTLHPAHQRSALARRSRQPRKVLNVFLTKYPLIRKLADELGFEMETSEDELNEYKFNLCWSDTVLSLMRLVRLSNWQRTNHFPSMYLLCRKGHLGTTLGKLRRRLPSHFAYYPRTWSMRSERMQFAHYMTAVRQRRILKYFIMKPNSGCQGRGIIVARDPLTALDDHTLDNYIVQEYVHRPLLLEGKKFDLRVYVLLTSIRHPSIFIFNEGLVRICTEAYETPNEENVKQACKHLTNYAVNKKSADYVFNTDVEHMDVGNKRNFRFLNRWLTESGYSPDSFWDEVGFIIVKTILAAQPTIARVYDSCFPTGFNDGYCCFEVLGFDILIDNRMKPWLMEVNHTPSFATETPLDFDIKSKLISEVWSIIDCKATDYEKDRQRERDEFARRNMPPWASNHPVYGSQLNKNGTTSSTVPSSRRGNGAGAAAPAEDGGDSSPDSMSSPNVNGEDAGEVPAYVLARRKHEDSKLQNFKRVYPTPDTEMQMVYDTIQNLATIESANSRLYYNSTVAAPSPLMPTSTFSSPMPMVRTSAVLPSRARPPSLGPVLTTSRLPGGAAVTGSPNTIVPQRSAAITPATPVVDTAPATIHVASVPSFTNPLSTLQNNNGTTSNASPPLASPAPSGSRDEHPSPSAGTTGSSVPKPMEKDALQRPRRRSSDARGSNATGTAAATVSGTSARSTAPSTNSPSESANTATAATSPSAGAAASSRPPQPLRVHTPRVSSAHGSGSHRAPPNATPTPPPQQQPQQQDAADGAKGPRVAEVHRRVMSRPTTTVVANMATTVPATAPAKDIADMVASHKSTPVHADKGEAARNSRSQSAVQEPSATTPIHIARPAHITKSPLSATNGSHGSSRARGGSHDLHPAQPVRRKSGSPNGAIGDEADGHRSGSHGGHHHHHHARQSSQDREGHSMLTHPEPTEEELARLATLQAMLDYEAAADPQPDEDDEDYNLTE